MDANYDTLRKVQLQERGFATLSKLDESFYTSQLALVAELKANASSLEKQRVADNTERVLKDVFELRKQKIFFKALRDLRNNSVDSSGMAAQEKELYTTLIKLLTDYDSSLAQTSSGVEVEFLTDIPEFTAVDGRVMGPFSKGTKALLSEKQAEIFLKRSAVKKI